MVLYVEDTPNRPIGIVRKTRKFVCCHGVLGAWLRGEIILDRRLCLPLLASEV